MRDKKENPLGKDSSLDSLLSINVKIKEVPRIWFKAIFICFVILSILSLKHKITSKVNNNKYNRELLQYRTYSEQEMLKKYSSEQARAILINIATRIELYEGLLTTNERENLFYSISKDIKGFIEYSQKASINLSNYNLNSLKSFEIYSNSFKGIVISRNFNIDPSDPCFFSEACVSPGKIDFNMNCEFGDSFSLPWKLLIFQWDEGIIVITADKILDFYSVNEEKETTEKLNSIIESNIQLEQICMDYENNLQLKLGNSLFPEMKLAVDTKNKINLLIIDRYIGLNLILN